MPNVAITKTVRDTVRGFLSDDTIGFNPTYQAICSDYGITPTFTIDFTGGKNFFQGYYVYNDLSSTSNIGTKSVMCLYSTRTQNTNQQKYHLFSGSTEMYIDSYVSFPQSAALGDIETMLDAVDSSFYNVFHTTANQHLWGIVSYNGDLSTLHGPAALRGSNWLALVRAKLTFDINAG